MSNESFQPGFSNEQVLQSVRMRLRQQADNAQFTINKIRQKYLVCQLNDEWYALNVSYIYEVSRVGTLTRVPNTPAYVLGIFNLRGNITAVIDVRDILGLDRRPINVQSSGRVVVCEADGARVGILAEAVMEVAEISQDQIEPPLLTLGPERSLYSLGVVQYNHRLLVLLNLPLVIEKLKV